MSADLYLGEEGTYTPLITAANLVASLPPDPKEVHLAFVEASSDLHRVAFSTGSGIFEWVEGAIAVLGASVDESVVLYVGGGGHRVSSSSSIVNRIGVLLIAPGACRENQWHSFLILVSVE